MRTEWEAKYHTVSYLWCGIFCQRCFFLSEFFLRRENIQFSSGRNFFFYLKSSLTRRFFAAPLVPRLVQMCGRQGNQEAKNGRFESRYPPCFLPNFRYLPPHSYFLIPKNMVLLSKLKDFWSEESLFSKLIQFPTALEKIHFSRQFSKIWRIFLILQKSRTKLKVYKSVKN